MLESSAVCFELLKGLASIFRQHPYWTSKRSVSPHLLSLLFLLMSLNKLTCPLSSTAGLCHFSLEFSRCRGNSPNLWCSIWINHLSWVALPWVGCGLWSQGEEVKPTDFRRVQLIQSTVWKGRGRRWFVECCIIGWERPWEKLLVLLLSQALWGGGT